MKWSLFIDDERFPSTTKNWKIARTGDEAFLLIEKFGFPEHISFDHDLGCDQYGVLFPTAYDFAKQIGEKVMDGKLTIPEDFTFYVHSQNPVGKKNIQNYMDDLMNHIRKENQK